MITGIGLIALAIAVAGTGMAWLAFEPSDALNARRPRRHQRTTTRKGFAP